jgi:DNA-binding NtrC family response regulator
MARSNLKILLVDDQRDICRYTALELEEAGFSVGQSFDAEDAFIKLINEKYDILITDFRMPNMNGVELIEKIQTSAIKLRAIYLISGYTDTNFDSSKIKGLTKQIQKPYEMEDLINELKKISE